MRVLVCGGRDFSDKSQLWRTLDRIFPASAPDAYGNCLPEGTLIHGGARGADALADQYAVANWLTAESYLADWKTHGRAAGPIRNQRMIDEGKPDVVVAFPGGRGTADMIRRAEAAGIRVVKA